MDRTLRRRLKVLERMPEYERDELWHAEVVQLKEEMEGVSNVKESQNVPASSERVAAPAPSIPTVQETPVAPPVKQESPKKKTNALHSFATALSLLQDLNSRTEFGIYPLLAVALMSLVLHPQVLAIAVFIMHAVLLAFYFSYTQQSIVRSIAIYTVRDYLPSVAVAIVMSGVTVR